MLTAPSIDEIKKQQLLKQINANLCLFSVIKTCLRRGGRGAQKAQKCAFVIHEWSLSAPLGFLFVLIFAKPSQKQKGGNEVMAPCFFEETLTFVATLLPCSYFSMMPYTSAY